MQTSPNNATSLVLIQSASPLRLLSDHENSRAMCRLSQGGGVDSVITETNIDLTGVVVLSHRSTRSGERERFTPAVPMRVQ